MPKAYMTVKEVAKLLGVTPLTIRNWDARGKLVAYRHPVNNYRMYKTEDVENILKEIEESKGKPPVARLAKSQAKEPDQEPEKPKAKKLEIDIF
jgi:MerR family transcriptional regulator, copper efflux regulator